MKIFSAKRKKTLEISGVFLYWLLGYTEITVLKYNKIVRKGMGK